jgi:hypothetical protein
MDRVGRLVGVPFSSGSRHCLPMVRIRGFPCVGTVASHGRNIHTSDLGSLSVRRIRSYTVILKGSIDPVFPCKCAVCLGAATTYAGLSHDSSSTTFGRWFPLLGLMGEGYIELPLCRRHWWLFRGTQLLRAWVLPILAVVLMVLTGRLVGAISNRGLLTSPLPLIVLFAMAATYVMLEIYRPRHFQSVMRDDEIHYEFRNRLYASAFCRSNGGRIEVS